MSLSDDGRSAGRTLSNPLRSALRSPDLTARGREPEAGVALVLDRRDRRSTVPDGTSVQMPADAGPAKAAARQREGRREQRDAGAVAEHCVERSSIDAGGAAAGGGPASRGTLSTPSERVHDAGRIPKRDTVARMIPRYTLPEMGRGVVRRGSSLSHWLRILRFWRARGGWARLSAGSPMRIPPEIKAKAVVPTAERVSSSSNGSPTTTWRRSCKRAAEPVGPAPAGALAPLRADLERRARHGAGAAAAPPARAWCLASRGSWRRSRRAREHRDTCASAGRTDPRRADHVRPEAGGLAFGRTARGAAGPRPRGRRVGTVSGAVGTYAHVARIEEYVLRAWASPASRPHAGRPARPPRGVPAGAGPRAARRSSVATEVRHLQRTEVREAEEPFTQGQKGRARCRTSATRSPASASCGLARVLRANAGGARERGALARARHLAHLGRARDPARLDDPVDYMLRRAPPGRRAWWSSRTLRENLELTRGGLYSQRGAARPGSSTRAGRATDAYVLVQRNARSAAWDTRHAAARAARRRARRALAGWTSTRCSTTAHYIRHADAIFARLDEIAPA